MSGRTIRRSLRLRHLNKRIAKLVDFIDRDLAVRRKDFAEGKYYEKPLPECWDFVFFSDEAHFGYDDEGKVYIYRKHGTRSDPDNLQERKAPDEEDQKELHAWAAIGIGYKSPLVFYEIPSNKNGKMTQKCYEEEILEKYVKSLIEEGRTFILEEDNDSGHGPKGNNRISRWKEAHGLLHYFNCAQSPDLSPIEDTWGFLKAKMG
ncbi:kinesin related 1 [Fusarium heterosporum]|uniref:Kinesin related 1 n=1 Tax=Fusarium heterosporum TaxID=42747 RepID=A0A8H5STZ0_FUSHE|nr:kinesin related 1 [Fusarium heterosporum]